MWFVGCGLWFVVWGLWFGAGKYHLSLVYFHGIGPQLLSVPARREGFGFWVLGFGFWVLGFGFWFWFSVLGLGFMFCL